MYERACNTFCRRTVTQSPGGAVYEIVIAHHFETAHRLSSEGAPLKCQSIHGHSWQVKAHLAGEGLDSDGMLLEFGAFKKIWRAWIDGTLDHALVLAESDPLAQVLTATGLPLRLVLLPHQPTTEVLARWIHEHTAELLTSLDTDTPVRLAGVHVQETRVNAVHYRPDP